MFFRLVNPLCIFIFSSLFVACSSISETMEEEKISNINESPTVSTTSIKTTSSSKVTHTSHTNVQRASVKQPSQLQKAIRQKIINQAKARQAKHLKKHQAKIIKVTKVIKAKKPTFYIVQSGDNVFNIMKKTKVDWGKIAKLNKLQPPYAIQPGQRLKLR